MKIGCKDYPISDWFNFTDEYIDLMDAYALKFWKQWKPVITSIIESNYK
jgi:hypothetical protein